MNRSLILAAAALAVVLSSCAGNKKDEGQAVAAEQVRNVTVTVTARQQVPQTGVYSSTVQANVVNNIASQTAGRVRTLNVEVGDFVEKGQVLAEMDRTQLDQAALTLKNNETEFERIKALFEEGGVSQSDYETAELSYNVSKSSYDNLLENTVLLAPVSGVITARNYDVGDMYAMSSPIYTLQQITPVKLLVPVSEMDYTNVHQGDKVSLTVDAIPGRTFTGSVVRVYPVIDPTSHTFNVEVHVPNTDRAIRPGMYARVTVTFGVNNSIVLPDTAVLKQQGSGVRTVFVLADDSTVEARIVTLGLHFDGKYEILSGLEEGETVVVTGNSSLNGGDKVEVVE